jgi:transposase
MVKTGRDQHRIAARWAVVHAGEKFGWDVGRTANFVRKPRAFVEQWITRYLETGTVNDKPRSGRPKLLSAAVQAAVEVSVSEQQSVPAAAAKLRSQQLLPEAVSNRTVLRAAHQTMELRHVEQRPILSVSSRNKRKAFSRQQHNPSRLLAIDSTYFTVGTVQRRRRVWVMRGQPVVAGRPNRSQQLHVYGGISVHGKTSLIRVTGTTGHPKRYYNSRGQLSGVGAEEFQGVLGDKLVPEGGQLFAAAGVRQWSVLMDNAPAHTAKSTKQYIRANGIPVVNGWPPNSPDLNPIKNAWAWVKRRVYAQHHNNLEELWDAVQRHWKALPEAMCRALMTSLSARKQRCLELDGAYTGY